MRWLRRLRCTTIICGTILVPTSFVATPAHAVENAAGPYTDIVLGSARARNLTDIPKTVETRPMAGTWTSDFVSRTFGIIRQGREVGDSEVSKVASRFDYFMGTKSGNPILPDELHQLYVLTLVGAPEPIMAIQRDLADVAKPESALNDICGQPNATNLSRCTLFLPHRLYLIALRHALGDETISEEFYQEIVRSGHFDAVAKSRGEGFDYCGDRKLEFFRCDEMFKARTVYEIQSGKTDDAVATLLRWHELQKSAKYSFNIDSSMSSFARSMFNILLAEGRVGIATELAVKISKYRQLDMIDVHDYVFQMLDQRAAAGDQSDLPFRLLGVAKSLLNSYPDAGPLFVPYLRQAIECRAAAIGAQILADPRAAGAIEKQTSTYIAAAEDFGQTGFCLHGAAERLGRMDVAKAILLSMKNKRSKQFLVERKANQARIADFKGARNDLWKNFQAMATAVEERNAGPKEYLVLDRAAFNHMIETFISGTKRTRAPRDAGQYLDWLIDDAIWRFRMAGSDT